MKAYVRRAGDVVYRLQATGQYIWNYPPGRRRLMGKLFPLVTLKKHVEAVKTFLIVWIDPVIGETPIEVTERAFSGLDTQREYKLRELCSSLQCKGDVARHRGGER